MEAEMTHHLGYEKHDPAGDHSGNSRNGASEKTISGDFGKFAIEVPRDRNSTFEPIIVRKRQRRWTGFDEKIIAMYALGMTTRQMEDQLKDLYGVDVSPTLISQVTDEVMDEVRTWAAKALREWIALARTVRHQAVSDFCRMLKRHAYGILNHCDYAIHTSVLEGVSNKIKVIKRMAYGYHDLAYFALKVIQAFKPKQLQLNGR